MTFRNVLFAIALTFAMIASVGLQPAAAVTQDDNTGNNTLTAGVTVNVGGVFDAFFCQPPGDSFGDLGTVNLNSQSPAMTVQQGSMTICYEDTKPDRSEFRTWVIAGNFTSGANSIVASNFKVTRTWWVAQTQWGPVVGDIGMVNSAGVLNGSDTGTCPICYATWSTGNTLDAWRYVQYGWDGKGTADGTGDFPSVWASGNPNLGAFGVIEVSLDVPVDTPAGSYTSTVTVEINFTAP